MMKIKLLNIKWLLVYTFCGFTACHTTASNKDDSPVNIIWIVADDYSPDAGCYGNEVVSTPNIDQLAAKGRLYKNAFATNPVCSPSRSAFYTGMYQTTIGAHQHRTENVKPLPGPVKMITHYFREKGYFTSNGNGYPNSDEGKTDFNFEPEGEAFDGSDWSQRAQGQPFFASVQIHYPHRVFEEDTLNPVESNEVNIPPYYPDHPLTREDWSRYLESVQLMDRRVGQVLQRLEEEGLTENTAIFFFADQGRPMVRAKQWLYEGGIKVPLIVKLPSGIDPGTVSDELISLIDISAASLAVAGIDIPEHLQGQNFLVEDVDRDYIFAARNRTDAVVDYIRCVRDQRFKYIKNFMPEKPYMQFGHYKAYRYPIYTLLKVLHQKGELTPAQAKLMAEQKPPEELYDLQNDPYELNNLAEDPAYQQQLKRMRDQLEQWMVSTNDKGDYDPDNMEALQKRRWEKYGSRWQSRGIDPENINWESYLQWWEQKLLTENQGEK